MARILWRSLLWALTGAATGVVLWAVLAGIAWNIRYPAATALSALRDLPLSILGTAFWAIFIGAGSVPLYVALFSVWLVMARSRPALEATGGRRALAAFLAGMPVALTVTHGFASSFRGFDWWEAAWIGPIALVSCWGAVGLPRRMVPALKRSLQDIRDAAPAAV